MPLGWEGNHRGLGPIDFQQTDRFRKCRSKIWGCPTGYQSDCCPVGACEICVRWEVYGETDRHGTLLALDKDTYAGTVAGFVVNLIWEERYDGCYFVLYVNGVEEGALPKCDPYNPIGCEEPAGTFPGVYLEYSTGDLVFYTEPTHRLPQTDGALPGTCNTAVLLLWDNQWRQDLATEDIQNGALTDAVNNLAASTDEYSLATVTFNDSTSSVHTAFSTNNGTAWLADIETITTSGGATLYVHSHRASAAGIDNALTAVTWPSDAQKKIIIFVNQGRPDSADPITPGNALELAQLASASDALAQGISVHCIQIPFVYAGPPHNFVHGAGHEGVAQSTAINGGGSYRSVNPNGTLDYNQGVNEVAPAIESLFSGVHCGDGSCAVEHPCGPCTCDKICVDINLTEPTCTGSGTLEWNASDGCEKIGWNDPQWEGDVTVYCGTSQSVYSVTLFLGVDQYDNCVIYGNANNYAYGSYGLEPKIVSGEGLSTSWTIPDVDGYGEITITISCLKCGLCEGVTVLCCPDDPLPTTLYADVSQLAAGMGEDCACAEGLYPLNNLFAQGAPLEPAGQWTSGTLPWLPCTGGLADYWTINLVCITTVWTLVVTWFDSDMNQVASTSNQPTLQSCRPFELIFTGDGLGSIIPSGFCTGGMTPATNEVIITP